jgi:hypothetical protein
VHITLIMNREEAVLIAIQPPRPRWGRSCLFVAAAALMIVSRCGCDDQSPSQQSVEQAWGRADLTAKQAAEAEQQLRHERRLRDIDRLRSEAEIVALETRLHTLRGLSLTLTLALLAGGVWLAVEIRRRRVLTAAMHNIVETQGETQRTPTNAPESDSGSSPP